MEQAESDQGPAEDGQARFGNRRGVDSQRIDRISPATSSMYSGWIAQHHGRAHRLRPRDGTSPSGNREGQGHQREDHREVDGRAEPGSIPGTRSALLSRSTVRNHPDRRKEPTEGEDPADPAGTGTSDWLTSSRVSMVRARRRRARPAHNSEEDTLGDGAPKSAGARSSATRGGGGRMRSSGGGSFEIGNVETGFGACLTGGWGGGASPLRARPA